MSNTKPAPNKSMLLPIAYLALTFAAGLLLAYRTGDRQALAVDDSGRDQGAEIASVARAPRDGGLDVDLGEQLSDVLSRLGQLEEEVGALRHQQAAALEREHARILEELTAMAKAHQEELAQTRAALSAMEKEREDAR